MPSDNVPLLMSATNPNGWRLEELLSQLCVELEAKTALLVQDARPVAQGVAGNNRVIWRLLHDARLRQLSSLAALRQVGPDQGPTGTPRVGPGSEGFLTKADIERDLAEKTPPVDRSARVLTDGRPVTDDHREINPATGQQKAYVVLTAEERAKGFVRPVRRTYIHAGLNPTMNGIFLIKPGEHGCGARTTMGEALAETYARDPYFYSGTFCSSCKEHRPLEEFIWPDDGTVLGT